MRKAILLMLAMLFGLSASGFAAYVTTSNVFDYDATVAAKDAAVSGVRTAGGALVGGDNIGDAVVIPGLPFHDTGNTCSFINDYDEVCPYTGSTSPDVVYSFSPAQNVAVTIDLCASSYDTKVYVYRNVYTPGAPYACNDDACGEYASQIENLQLYGGETYYIVVDGYGSACGDYVLDVASEAPCALECPLNALQEGEPTCYDGYVDNYNGGCNSDPDVFQVLEPGCGTITVCGTSGVYDGYSTRDTDWFQIALSEQSDLMFCCTAEFPLLIFLLDGNSGCDPYIITSATAGECEQACIQYTLGAGTYWLWVGPSEWGDIPCGSDYVMTLDGYRYNEGPCCIDPTLLDFGSVEVGSYLDKDFTIINTWGEPLSGSVSEACIPYSIVSGDGDFTLMPGESLAVTVRFSPMVIDSQICDVDAGPNSGCPVVRCTGKGAPIFCSFECWSWTGDCLRGPNRDVSSLPACLRDDQFDGAFPDGLVVGVDAPGRHTVTWTSAAAVQAFRCGYGLPAALGSDYVDPASNRLGSIYGQMVALRMNRQFSCKGYFSDRVKCYGDEVVPPEGLKFAGLTVDQLLKVADEALSGNSSALLPYGNSLMRLESALALMNRLDEGSGWAAKPPPGLHLLDDGDSEEAMEPVPAEISVTSRPNPLESSVTIGLALPAAGNVSLDLYDVRGRRVATIASGPMSQGNHDVTWAGVDDSGAPVASGVYFLRVRVDGRVAVMHKLTKL
jgi:hypothetical protein